MAMLDNVKVALRLTTTAYDNELTNLIASGIQDLGISGVITESVLSDPLLNTAVITYCKMHFGSPPDFDKLKKIYDEQKAQLSMATGYTDWGDS